WTQRTPATTAPPARRSHQMATDPATGYALVFGGWNGSGSSGTLFADTWIWDGADWTALPAAGPSARADAATAANPTAGILAVAGGLTGLSPTEFADDVWQWQTTSWTRSNRGSLPAPIYDYGAAYDERRGEVVVFGGQTDCSPISPVVIDDMWIWKEGAWEQRNPPFRPSPRSYDRLCYDAARDRVVLYGGNGGGTPLGDTWEWDGTRWTLRLPLASPPAGGGNGVSYDERQGVTVVYGSIGAFEYGPTSPARIVPFGSGCPGSAGIPSLAPKPWAGPWLGDRAEIDIVDAPPGLGLFVWGFSNTTWIGGALPFSLAPLGGGPGCNLLVSDTIVQLFVSNTNPYPYVSFVLPGDPSFLGAVMYAQAGFLDAGLGGAPVVSHGLELTFGAK
ncbi:MAG: hypothetical protein KDE27_10785, partial [Planctomycetes bacterium]|nr:hypothetical protein [Planctomycetota bacterium]